MADKYHCTSCGRRFVDWGAKKLEFKCPTSDCNQSDLLLLDSDNFLTETKPKAKRSVKRKTPVLIANPEEKASELDDKSDFTEDHDLAEGVDSEADDDDSDDEHVKLEKE